MKLSLTQLRQIIQENTSPAPMKSRATPFVRNAVENSRQQERLQEMQSRESREAEILVDLDRAIRNVEETAENMYGLENPDDPGIDMGTEMSQDLLLAVEMMNSAFRRLEALFQGQD